MVFFENKENSEKISKGLLGKGTQMPSPSPDPFSCWEMQESFYESGNCVQIIVPTKGFTPFPGVAVGTPVT